MKSNLKVSIVVPFYKGEKYISNCIDSILNQTYKNYELILIENGPKDNSENIIKEYHSESIKYYYIEEGNVSNARNFGIKKASGDFIYFVDGDDFLNKDCLEKCVRNIVNKKVDLVMFNFNKVSEKNTTTIELPWKNVIFNKKQMKERLIPPMISVEENEHLIMGSVWRIFTYKKNLDGLEFNKDIKVGEDLIFCIELFCRVNSIYIMNDILYNYTLSSSSTLNMPKKDVIYQSIVYHDVLKKILIKENLFDKLNYRFMKNQGRMYTSAISFASRFVNIRIARDEIKKIVKVYNQDSNNYLKLNYSFAIKLTFILMKLRMTFLLYILYKIKEKIRIKNYNR